MDIHAAGRETRGSWLRGLWALLAGCALAGAAQAAGTPAGTLIGNTATLSYSLPGKPNETAVAVAPNVAVARVVEVLVTWQDAAAIPTGSPDTGRAVAFAVTNAGNGPETFRLTRNDALAGDQFDPQPAAIWIESGAQPGLQTTGPAADTLYGAGVNDPTLPADASLTVYLAGNIPAGVPTGSFGGSRLTATATTPGAAGAAPGSLLGSFGGIQAVAGRATQAGATGSYLVAGVSMGLAKSVTGVRDPAGGTRVMSGAVLTYRIVLTLAGSGIAEAVAMQDPLPATLTYVPGSLSVDGTGRTDAADGDGVAAANNTVTADFGSVTAPATRVIEFRATVN
jgi:uncharacterized repeat protein (TIGR01451 family)